MLGSDDRLNEVFNMKIPYKNITMSQMDWLMKKGYEITCDADNYAVTIAHKDRKCKCLDGEEAG